MEEYLESGTNLTSYSYDAADRLISSVHASNTINTYDYDKRGNLIRKDINGSNQKTYKRKSYGRNGNIIQPFAFTGYQCPGQAFL